MITTSLAELDLVESDADISDCEKYRYRLWRIWDPAKPMLCWAMLNPSTADKKHNDATILKIIGFAKRWGYGGIMVVNLFAWRARDPSELRVRGRDLLGDNDLHLQRVAREYGKVVCAWGAHAVVKQRAQRVTAMFQHFDVEMVCLRLTKGGQPWHPLFVPGATELIPYDGALVG